MSTPAGDCHRVVLSLFLMTRRPQRLTLFPYTTLFRSGPLKPVSDRPARLPVSRLRWVYLRKPSGTRKEWSSCGRTRSEEHTSELQSHSDLVCRLLLEKKKRKHTNDKHHIHHERRTN